MRRHLANTRSSAQRLITEGRVKVGGVIAPKPATMVSPDTPVELIGPEARFVSRGGDFSDIFEGTTDIAGTLGFGLRFGLGRATQLRFDVRDYISSFAPTRSAEEFDSRLQNDVIATIGLEFVLRPME